MARRFRRTRRGYEVQLDDVESALLIELVADLQRLLDEPAAGDEVLERLFPDGYRDDPAAAADLRGLIEDDLREGKRAALRALTESFAERDARGWVRLDDAGAEAWLGALNDLRLSLGTRLDITEEAYDEQDAELSLDDPRRQALEVYAWLTWLQDGLVDVLMSTLDAQPDAPTA